MSRKTQGDCRPSASQRREYRGRLWQGQDKVCAWCKVPLPSPKAGQLDRIVPGARGGRYNISNLVLSCVECNQDHGHQVQQGTDVPRTRPEASER